MKKIFAMQTLLKLTPLIIIIIIFILYRAYKWGQNEYSEQNKIEEPEGFQNQDKKYMYVSTIKNSGQTREEEPAIKNGQPNVEFSFIDLIKDTITLINYLKMEDFKLVDTENIGKYEMDIMDTNMFIKKTAIENELLTKTIEEEYGKYFTPEINEKTLREFNEKIKAENYLVNSIGVHLYTNNRPVSTELHKFKNYFIVQMGAFIGNSEKINQLKTEFFEWISLKIKMRLLVNEYTKYLLFNPSTTELAYLLDITTAELKKLAEIECHSEWLPDEIIFYIFNYIQIVRPIYNLLISSQLYKNMRIVLTETSIQEFSKKDGMDKNICAKLYLQ